MLSNDGWRVMMSLISKLRIIAVLLLIAAPREAWSQRASRAGSNPAPRNVLVVTSEPDVIVNGSPCLFRVKSQRPLKSLLGKWQGRSVFFNFDGRDGTWYGFAGVGIDVAAGRRRLTLEAITANGARFLHTHPVRI